MSKGLNWKWGFSGLIGLGEGVTRERRKEGSGLSKTESGAIYTIYLIFFTRVGVYIFCGCDTLQVFVFCVFFDCLV